MIFHEALFLYAQHDLSFSNNTLFSDHVPSPMPTSILDVPTPYADSSSIEIVLSVYTSYIA